MGREREVGKAIPAATGTGLGLDSAALCHDLFGVCAGEVWTRRRICAVSMRPPHDAGHTGVVLFVDHAYCQLTGRSRGAAERWLLRACAVCVREAARREVEVY